MDKIMDDELLNSLGEDDTFSGSTDKGDSKKENISGDGKNKSVFGKKFSKEDKYKEEVELLKEEKAELNDKFLRLYSEFDNYKKRTLKEKLELIETASERVIIEILPILDDFERAIKANENVHDISAVKEGFELIYNKLSQTLKKAGVEPIQAIGENFDTDYHEAITHVPVQDEDEKGKVLDVIEKGYTLKNKVIRYAKVVVGN